MKRNKNLAEWVTSSTQELKSITDTPQLEAQLIVAHVVKQSRTWLVSHLDHSLDEHQSFELETLLSNRLQLVPLPYILGKWSFYGLDFIVSPDVLIPRPETELLVSEALNWIQNHPGQNRVVDVGTGSGCITVSLAQNMPSIHMSAIDISMPALKIAMRNAIDHQVISQISFIQSDLLSALAGPFDIICANLPYIPSTTLETLPVRLYEPVSALDGGTDGLNFIRRLLVQSINHISPEGLLLFEIEAGQGDAVLQLARDSYPQSKCQILADLAGLPRLLRIEVN
jgi:release factor glutamine methyltransferase